MFTERKQRCIELQNYVREQMIDSIIEDLHDIHAKYTTKHEVYMQEVADQDASAFIAGLIRCAELECSIGFHDKRCLIGVPGAAVDRIFQLVDAALIISGGCRDCHGL